MKNFETYIKRLPAELVQRLIDCEQNPKWHAEGNVFNHTKLVFEYADNFYNGDNDLLVAAIFHDLGKPETAKLVNKEGIEYSTNYGHEYASLKYINEYFNLYSDLSTNKEKIYEICQNHMRAHLYESGKLKKAEKRKAFENLKYFDDIMKFLECDSNGRLIKE